MKITQLELTVLAVTLRDSLDAPDPDGKAFAFGRAARRTIWAEIVKKLKAIDFEFDIQ